MGSGGRKYTSLRPCDIWHKYHLWYFKIVSNFTRLTAREIMFNNFEISLVVFMPNITTNHAITHTNWNWILSRRVYISLPPRFNKHIWALLPENLTRAYIDIVFQYLSRSQIIFASASWLKWLNGLNSSYKKFIWYSAVLLHCVGIETLLLKVRCRSVRRTWELSILVPREITRRWIHSHQHHS